MAELFRLGFGKPDGLGAGFPQTALFEKRHALPTFQNIAFGGGRPAGTKTAMQRHPMVINSANWAGNQEGERITRRGFGPRIPTPGPIILRLRRWSCRSSARLMGHRTLGVKPATIGGICAPSNLPPR